MVRVWDKCAAINSSVASVQEIQKRGFREARNIQGFCVNSLNVWQECFNQ